MTRMNQAGAFLNEANTAMGLARLGATLNFVDANGTLVITGINMETTEVLLNTYGFLAQSADFRDLPADALHNIVMNKPHDFNWQELPPDLSGGLDEAQQREVFEEFAKYQRRYPNNEPFTDALNEVRDSLSGADAARFNELRERYGVAVGTYTSNYPTEMIRFLNEQLWGN